MEDLRPFPGTVEVASRSYIVALVGFFASVGLLLITVVEMRRAFLFPLSNYLKIGAPSPIIYLDIRHLPLIAIGTIGASLSFRYLVRTERDLKVKGLDLISLTRLLGFLLMGLFMVDSLVSPILTCKSKSV